MKKLKLLRRKKGFTLIECIVAIAIFGIMSMMIMQILALSIAKHRNNVHIEKDMDAQIQNIVSDNALVERETTDIAVDFVMGGSVVAGLEIEDVSIKKNPDNELENNRLQLNTFDASIAPDTLIDTSDSDTGSMMTEAVHIYGSKGITHVYVYETSRESGGVVDVTFEVEVYDENSVISTAESNAIKFKLPQSSKGISVTIDGDKMSYLRLSDTSFRFYALNTGNKETEYNFTIKFKISKDAYDSEYRSYAKYFIDPESTQTLNCVSFTDANTPGIYNTVITT